MKLEIIVSAYSCGPEKGSEPGMAWAWVKHLSKFHKIHLITSCEFKAALISGIRKHSLEDKVLLYFNDIGERATRMGQNQGDWRFYYYYRKWHKETCKMAKQIISTHQIDLVHQLNMIGFREPGYLWKIEKPSVWGPVGGLNFIPTSFILKSNWKSGLQATIKNIINYVQIKFSPKVNSAVKNFNVVLGAIKNSKEAFLKFKRIDVPVLNETGCYVKEGEIKEMENRFSGKSFNVLWVGKFQFRKQLSLALEVIYKLRHLENLKFHIVGVNKEEADVLVKKCLQLKIQKKVNWVGKISHEEVHELMSKYELFLFTSIDEGTPHVILEAIQNRLPIVCFDTCGQGECVNEKVGIKIPLENPKKAVEDFSNALLHLNENRELLASFSHNCIKRGEELSWDSKTQIMNGHYLNAIKTFKETRT